MLAVKKGAPVIPVAIEGSYRPFSKVKVVFGKPFYIETDPSKKYSNAELAVISQNIMEKVYGLLK